MEKKLMDTATKTGIDAEKTAFRRIVPKTTEATGELIGNKIADKINKKKMERNVNQMK